jgi:hypothetical protein
MNNVIKFAQMIMDKYTTSEDQKPEQVMQAIGDIEELLVFIKGIPWLNDQAISEVINMERQISKLHAEILKSIKSPHHL